MDPLTSAHEAWLQECVAACYDVFGRGHVSPTLEVCHCPVCMTEETRASIIATRTDRLPPDLIREYSNSAHGVPNNLDDLKLLLPRYLDLMARDEEVDDIGVGTELLRFGEALRCHPGLFDARERAVLDDWARAVLLHFAWAEARAEPVLSPYHLLDVLLCGGWPVGLVTETLDAAFADSQIGPTVFAKFAGMASRNLLYHGTQVWVDWYGLGYVTRDMRQQVADWLNALTRSPHVLERLTDPSQPGDPPEDVQMFCNLSGRFAGPPRQVA